MKDIIIKGLEKSYGEKRVLAGFSAVFPAGETTCIMGPSGCGKTTLLNILMGLEKADSGSISGLPRDIAAVFQEDRLCEDFSALSNLRMVSAQFEPSAAQQLLRELELGGELETPVRELSGGMKRRVAIARALYYRSELLILDEAFKGLDSETKQHTIDCLKRRTAGKTVIAVTHDAEEAQYLGGNILHMQAL